MGRLLSVALAWACLPTTALAQTSEVCPAGQGALRLDHAIIVVRDLDVVAARFRQLGFRLKVGRLHADSLLNQHVKFRDGTELELMSLAGAPTSPMAREYAARLVAGDQGVYAALWTNDLRQVTVSARALQIPARSTTLGGWEFLSFPDVPDAGAIFFGSGDPPPADTDSVPLHANGAGGLAAAWIEAGPAVDSLLVRLGAQPCGASGVPDGRRGTRWALGSGSLVLVRPRAAGGPLRLLGIEVRRRVTTAVNPPRLVEPIQGFWVMFR